MACEWAPCGSSRPVETLFDSNMWRYRYELSTSSRYFMCSSWPSVWGARNAASARVADIGLELIGCGCVRSLCGEESYLAPLKRSWPVHGYGERRQRKRVGKGGKWVCLIEEKSYGLIVFNQPLPALELTWCRWLNLTHLDCCRFSSSIPCLDQKSRLRLDTLLCPSPRSRCPGTRLRKVPAHIDCQEDRW